MMGLSEFEDELRSWLSGALRVIVAGIGNPLRKDDYVGVKIVKDLEGKVSENVFLIECETVPESFIEPIIQFKPTHILLIDAALLNQKPAAIKFMEPNFAKAQPISTHALPLQVFCEYLQVMTGAKIKLLAIQPENTDFGEGLTPKIEKTAKQLADILAESLP
ncbi:MAG: hydrogenase 3 maturation endopeptidase HyCI [Candidatus Bathyarchaeia archaeon]